MVRDCRYCVCPFYHCKIEGLGVWIKIESGGKIWDCSNCNLPHRKEFIEMISEIKEKNKLRKYLLMKISLISESQYSHSWHIVLNSP